MDEVDYHIEWQEVGWVIGWATPGGRRTVAQARSIGNPVDTKTIYRSFQFDNQEGLE